MRSSFCLTVFVLLELETGDEDVDEEEESELFLPVEFEIPDSVCFKPAFELESVFFLFARFDFARFAAAEFVELFFGAGVEVKLRTEFVFAEFCRFKLVLEL